MGARWEPWEDELIREYYPEHGSRWEGWGYHLADRSEDAIRKRAKTLGIRLSPRDPELRLWKYGNYQGKAKASEWAEILGLKKSTVIAYAAPSMQGMRCDYVFERVE